MLAGFLSNSSAAYSENLGNITQMRSIVKLKLQKHKSEKELPQVKQKSSESEQVQQVHQEEEQKDKQNPTGGESQVRDF